MTTVAEALAQLDGKAVLTADDAMAFRHVVFGGDQVITTQQADALVKLNADAGSLSTEWRMLYIEVLIHYVLRQALPEGYVDDAKADWLIGATAADSCAKEDEIEILICVLEQAEFTPPRFSAYVLNALKAQILGRRGAPSVSRDDVERLRRVVFAAGGDQNIGVSRNEAEALFDINDGLGGAPSDPAWSDFFVRAVANAVLYEATYHAPDAQAALTREAWLADTAFHPLGFLSGWVHPRAAFAAAPNVEQAWRAGLAADDALEALAAQITPSEGHWLAERIGKAGGFDANEQALVRFLTANAANIDPALQPLIARLSTRARSQSAA